jgi:thiamine phosphate synthase YjbQ (UPF0047 family)
LIVATGERCRVDRLTLQTEHKTQLLGKGDRNPWAHVRAALTSSSLTIPLVEDKLALGDLQAVFLCEFDGPRAERTVLVTVI